MDAALKDVPDDHLAPLLAEASAAYAEERVIADFIYSTFFAGAQDRSPNRQRWVPLFTDVQMYSADAVGLMGTFTPEPGAASVDLSTPAGRDRARTFIAHSLGVAPTAKRMRYEVMARIMTDVYDHAPDDARVLAIQQAASAAAVNAAVEAAADRSPAP